MRVKKKWFWVPIGCVLAFAAWSSLDKDVLKGVAPEVKSLVNFYEIRQFDSVRFVSGRIKKKGLDDLDSASTIWYWSTMGKADMEVYRRTNTLNEAIAGLSKYSEVEVVKLHLLLFESVALMRKQEMADALKRLEQLEGHKGFETMRRVFKSIFYEQLAKVYEGLNEFEKAETTYLKFINVLGNASRLNNRKAICHYWVGNYYSRLRNTSKAILSYETSLQLAQKEEKPEKFILAFNYQNLSTAYRNDQNIEAAINMGRRAMNMIRQMYPENHPATAYTYDDFGHIFTLVNNDSALHYIKKAVHIRETYYPNGFEELSRSYRGLGAVISSLGHKREAIGYYQKSNEAMSKIDRGHISIGVNYNAIGTCYSDLLEFDTAIQWHMKALEVYTDSSYGIDSGFVLPRVNQFKDLFFGIETLYSMGVTQNWAFQNNKEGEWSQRILQCTHLALELGDSVWGNYDLKSEKTSLSQYIHGLTENGIFHAYHLNESTGDRSSLETAFLCSEWRRATLLTEASNQVGKLDSVQIPPSLAESEVREKNRIEFLQTQLDALRTHPDKYADLDEKELTSGLVSALRKHDSLSGLIDEIAPNYLKLKGVNRRPTLLKATSSIPDSTTVLDYVLTTRNESDNHNLFALVMSREKVDFVRIQVDTGFGGVCNDFKAAIQDKDYEAYVQKGHDLYKVLIEPLGELKERLVIIPDGPLHYLSFDALLSDKPDLEGAKDYQNLDYLVNDFAISYANSVGYMLSVNAQAQIATNRVLGLAPFAE